MIHNDDYVSEVTVIAITMNMIMLSRMKMMIYMSWMREDCAPLQDLHRDGNSPVALFCLHPNINIIKKYRR